MMLSLTWGACVKIAVLIVFAQASKNMVKKLQEKFCPICKPTDSCCK